MLPWVAKAGSDTGAVDRAYGTDGVAVVPPPEGVAGSWPRGLFEAGQGRVLVAAGVHGPEPGTPGSAVVTRLLPSGEIDSSFGVGGRTVLEEGPGAPIEDIEVAAVQPAGGVILAGWSRGAGVLRMHAVRLDAEGDPDEEFGAEGVATIEVPADLGYVTAAITDADGRILLGGSMVRPGAHPAELDFVLARFEPDGDPDPLFGDRGIVIENIGTTGPLIDLDLLHAIDVAPNGDVVAVGETLWSTSAGSGDLAVLRLDELGSRVTGFGEGGVVVGGVGDRSIAHDVEAAGDAVTIAGSSETGEDYSRGMVARFDDGGGLDADFGDATSPGVIQFQELVQVRQIADGGGGRVLATGDAYVSAVGVARLLPGGVRDEGFGQSGVVRLDLNDETEQSGNELAGGVLARGAGRVLVLVRVEPLEGSDGSDLVLAQLHGEPTVQTTLTSAPPASSIDTTPVFEFIADRDGATFACRLDSSAWFGCESPLELGPLAAGSHTFDVAASLDGIADPTPASHAFAVEAASPPPPDTEVTGARFAMKRPQRPPAPGVGILLAAGAGEAVTASADGQVRLPKVTLPLTADTGSANPDALAKLDLAPRTPRARTRVRRALDAGRRVLAFVSATLADEAGNVVRREWTLRLLGPTQG